MPKAAGHGRYKARNGRTYKNRKAAVRSDRQSKKTKPARANQKKRQRRRKQRYK